MEKEKYRKGVFIIVYCRIKNKIKYLLLKRKLHWTGWEFPKGGIEKKEKILEAVKRELKEETGLTPLKIKKFDFSGKYLYDKKYLNRKEFAGQTFEALYAVEVKKSAVKLDKQEHSEYKWVKFNECLKKLEWPNQKECLKKVNDWIRN